MGVPQLREALRESPSVAFLHPVLSRRPLSRQTRSIEGNIRFPLAEGGEFGHFRVDAVKTSIDIAAKSHFAGVQVLKTTLKLGFMYDRPLGDRRVLSRQRLSDTNWSHTVRLAQEADVDAQLLDWLRHVYPLRR